MNVHQPITFAHKKLQMEGITVFWDEFADVSQAGFKSSPPPPVGLFRFWLNSLHVLAAGQ